MAAVSVASRPMASARRGSSPRVPPRPSGRRASRTSPLSVRSILDDVHDPEHPPLVAERSLAHRPAVVELAEEVLLGHLHVGEEDLVEVGVVRVGELGQGPARDAGRAHVDDQHADAAVLGGLGVGAHVAHAVVGLVGPRGPHLLPVHHEVGVAPLGLGGQRGQVAARVGLAHADAPRDLALQRREDEALLLLLVPELDDGGGTDGEALRVERARRHALGDDLEVDHLLLGRRVAAAELGRPSRHEVARLEHLALEGARPVRQVRRRAAELLADRLGWRQVLVEPRLELAAEPAQRFVGGEAHGQL